MGQALPDPRCAINREQQDRTGHHAGSDCAGDRAPAEILAQFAVTVFRVIEFTCGVCGRKIGEHHQGEDANRKAERR
jgi:hypothetical protein